MLQSFRSRKSSVLLWILMGMLIVGLAGFGIPPCAQPRAQYEHNYQYRC